MFFVLSKVLGFFAIPSNLVISIGILGLLLLPTRFARAGRRLAFASLVILAILGLSPLGNALIMPLEERFPPWNPAHGAPDGIIVLGGAISPDVSAARNEVALNEAAERLTVAAELALRYPDARILFSGGSGALIFGEGAEAEFAARVFESFGIPRRRVIARGSLAQHGRECDPLQGSRPTAAGRALAAGDVRLSHAAGHRHLSQGGFRRRALSGRLAHERERRRIASVSDRGRRLAAHRHRRARMGRPRGLLAHGTELGVFSRAQVTGASKKSPCQRRFAPGMGLTTTGAPLPTIARSGTLK